MFSVYIDAPKGVSYYPQYIMLQFYVCYHKNYYATLMLLEKLCFMKININFRDQVCNKPPAKCWVKYVFHFTPSCSKFLLKILSYFRKLKMQKTNNIVDYHLVSCHIISATSVVWLVYIDAQKGASYYLKNIMLQFNICCLKNYYAT